MKWDVVHNKEFATGCVTLAQGKKGVPIGGFLSEQLGVLWGMYSQGLLFKDKTLSPLLPEVVDRWDPKEGTISLPPRGTLTFPNVVYAPKDRDEFNKIGMHGWVKPENRVFTRPPSTASQLTLLP